MPEGEREKLTPDEDAEKAEELEDLEADEKDAGAVTGGGGSTQSLKPGSEPED